jgi:hypothetical protein
VTPIAGKDGLNFQMYDYTEGSIDLSGILAPFIRFGDFRSTGYPTAFATLVNQSSNFPSTYYIDNVGCSGDDCHNLKVKNSRML